MIIAELYTERFNFLAAGTDKGMARQAMIAGLTAHGKQYDLEPKWYREYISSISYTTLNPGQCVRDGELLLDFTTGAGSHKLSAAWALEPKGAEARKESAARSNIDKLLT